jgi:hypothetical protein
MTKAKKVGLERRSTINGFDREVAIPLEAANGLSITRN